MAGKSELGNCPKNGDSNLGLFKALYVGLLPFVNADNGLIQRPNADWT